MEILVFEKGGDFSAKACPAFRRKFLANVVI